MVLPTLKEVGDGWKRGEIEISQEHFASNLVRGRLLALARFWGRGRALSLFSPAHPASCTTSPCSRSRSSCARTPGGSSFSARTRRSQPSPARPRRRGRRSSSSRASTPPCSRRRPPACAGWPGGAARARRPRRNRRAQRPSRRSPSGRRSRRGSRRSCADVTVSVSGPQRPLILLTGATGYVGGRLLRAARGARGAGALPGPPPGGRRRAPRLDDDRRAATSSSASPCARRCAGVEIAYYLVHSMGSATSFEEQDRRGAAQLRRRGARGGRAPDRLPRWARRRRRSLEPPREPPGSRPHSRRLGRADDRVPGLDRDRLGQPLVRDAPRAGRAAAGDDHAALGEDRARSRSRSTTCSTTSSRRSTSTLDGSTVFEIGGADQVSYDDLMREYARQRGLRRWIIPVPILTPRLSSLWLGLVTPIYARVGRKLIDSLPHETVVRDPRAPSRLPDPPARLPARRSPRALRERGPRVRRRPAGPTPSPPRACAGALRRRAPRQASGRLARDPGAGRPRRRRSRPIRRIGGETGWYFGDRLWRLRGFVDLLVGGVGVRRGRRDPETPTVGSALDFWRVEAYEPDRLLRLPPR